MSKNEEWLLICEELQKIVDDPSEFAWKRRVASSALRESKRGSLGVISSYTAESATVGNHRGGQFMHTELQYLGIWNWK